MAKKSHPPTETVTPATGPNPDGLTDQARAAQAPDPAATARRTTARKRSTTKSTRATAKRATTTDAGAESGSDD